MIIAVDFDGTCVEHRSPEIGADIGARQVLNAIVKAGHKIILLTMRGGIELEDAVDWFEMNGIPLWAVNDNPEQGIWTDSRKVDANIYIDDAALGAPTVIGVYGARPYINWVDVRRILCRTGVI